MRRHTGKQIIFAAVVCLFAAAGYFPAAAADTDNLRGGIKRVRIRIVAEEFDDRGRPEADFVTDSGEYEVSGFEEVEADVYEVELTAGEGEVFETMGQKDIRFTGIPASCSRAVRKDGKATLVLTVRAEGLKNVTGAIGHAGFRGNVAVWDQADNADSYQVMLFRNSKRVGHTHQTRGNRFDFTPLMRDEGSYHYKVYPISVNGKKGVPAESERKTVDRHTAEKNSTEYEERYPENPGCPGWALEENGGWRYWQKDGTLPQETWLTVDGKRYYFDGEGYMAAGGENQL